MLFEGDLVADESFCVLIKFPTDMSYPIYLNKLFQLSQKSNQILSLSPKRIRYSSLIKNQSLFLFSLPPKRSISSIFISNLQCFSTNDFFNAFCSHRKKGNYQISRRSFKKIRFLIVSIAFKRLTTL